LNGQYYLPWKLTKDQEDLIESQIHDAREIISRELEEFKERERRHEERYGHRRLTPPPRAFDAPPKQAQDTKISVEKVDEAPAKTNPTAAVLEQKPAARAVRQDHEDDPGDVMVEAGEDMVIY
jgi:hypothetical protein